MKGKNPCITLLGNNSGRNLGDAAILSSILESLSQELPGARFYVPSISPAWIRRHYGSKYNVEPLNVMPWTLSLRLLGLPTIWAMARSDAALICDGIIFGKKLFNPAFNYLITLIFLAPLAKLLRCKMICFNCGIGPFPSRISRIFARWVINGCDVVMMRDPKSKHLAEELGVTRPIRITGDSAFINPVSDRARALEVCRAENMAGDIPKLGINVTSYLDMWLNPDERLSRGADLLQVIAEGLKMAEASMEGPVQKVVFCTQPMDLQVSSRLSDLLGAALVDNTRYLSHDIQAVMRECSLLVGMRFHSLILATAVQVPVVGLIYAPKVRDLMQLLETPRYGLELAQLSAENLAAALAEAWKDRDELRRKQQSVVEGLRQGARLSSRLLKEECFDEAN